MLGTPPAFILSQDQTLMFHSCPPDVWLPYFTFLCSVHISLNVFCAPDSSGAPLKSFKVIPLFSYQCPLQLLSKPLFVFVVNRQLLDITITNCLCQQLFLFFLFAFCCATAYKYYHILQYLSTTFFICIFMHVSEQKLQILFGNRAEKEGFEPSRRY